MSIPSIPRDGRSPLSPTAPERAPDSVGEMVALARHRLPRLARSGAHFVTRPARAIAFWTAIALPFLHLGLLADGLGTTSETTTFLVLIVANLVALYLGHSHGRAD